MSVNVTSFKRRYNPREGEAAHIWPRGEGEWGGRGSAVPSADLRPGALQALGDEESVPRHKDVVNAAHLR